MIETYVGVAGGITSLDEIKVLRQAMPACPFRRLAVGVLVNEKTLRCEKITETPNRYIDVHDISKVFRKDPLLINMIHLSLPDSRNLLSSMERLTMLGGANLNGFQINMKWPDPEVLKRFRIKWLETRRSQPWIILQIGKDSLEDVGNCSLGLCKKLLEYNDCITDVLIDPSGGSGILTEAGDLEKYVRSITFEYPNMGIGLAGGLTAKSLEVVEEILWKYPNLSVGSGRVLCNDDGSIALDAASEFIKKVFMIQECFME